MRLFCSFLYIQFLELNKMSFIFLVLAIIKSSRGPKFDGDAKQTLEIRVKRKVACKSLRLQRAKKGGKRGKKRKKKVLAAAGNRTRDQHFLG